MRAVGGILLDAASVGPAERGAPCWNNTGWTPRHVDDLELGEAVDEVILAAAREDDRIVVSSDTDFGGLLDVARAAGPSVILTRAVADLRATALAELLVAAIGVAEEALDAGAIVAHGSSGFLGLIERVVPSGRT